MSLLYPSGASKRRKEEQNARDRGTMPNCRKLRYSFIKWIYIGKILPKVFKVEVGHVHVG